jgi:YD repeat-containing protein
MTLPGPYKNCSRCGSANPSSAQTCGNCVAPLAVPPSYGRLNFAVPLVFVTVLVLTTVVVIAVSNFLVIWSRPYGRAITIAQSSPKVRELLGDNVHELFPAIGFSRSSDGEEFTQFAVALSGSRGRGRLYAVSNEINGVCEFSRLVLKVNSSGERIDLAPKPRVVALPNVPAKKVYLIPADLDADERLDWAPDYYKAKLGIDVGLLPAISIPPEVGQQRGQLDADSFLDKLPSMYQSLADDPANILIAVTSRDIYASSLGWSYTENLRSDDRFAMVSSARLHPPSLLARANPEWSNSRLQKLLTKNIAVLYFDLPMSSDYTSMLSGGILSGAEIDLMSGSIIGAERRWDPFVDEDDVEVTLSDVPGKPLFWRMASSYDSLRDTSAHSFKADLSVGLFISGQVDFNFDGAFPLQLERVYRNEDPMSRAFGIGTNDSMDIFLAGQMGHYIDLVHEDGSPIRFEHAPYTAGKGDTYKAAPRSGDPFSKAEAFYRNNMWTVERKDGWKFYFPFRPKALPSYVTVLTGFGDPAGHKYAMVRDDFGGLLSITTPSGEWLHFERDAEHRVHVISGSSGRSITYDYDAGGRLSRVSCSDGHTEHYAYDDKADMLSVSVGSDAPILKNDYSVSGSIVGQTFADGRKFEYHYTRDEGSQGNVSLPDLITDPNGLLTYIEYQPNGYRRSLPSRPFHYN